MPIRRFVSLQVVLLGATVLAVSLPLGAQGSPRIVQVVVSGGLTVPSGDLKAKHDNGFHYDGSLIFNIPGLPIALRPEVSLTTLKLKNTYLPSAPNTAGYGSGDNTKLLAGIGNIEVPLAGGVYLIGGLGAMNLQSRLTPTSADSSQTALIIDAGAGLRFAFARIQGFVEARMGTASYEAKKFGYSKAQFIPISFGLVF